MIVVRQLTKSFGKRVVLDRLDLEIAPGSITLLAGANGAGKTTLLRILVGLARPDSGEVLLKGISLRNDRRQALAQLAFLPQAPRFHPRLTARQVASYYGRLRGTTRAAVEGELARWDLLGHADAITSHLSGGMRQRLALAVFALARAPIGVLDEPGLSLDPEWRDRLQAFLVEEAGRGGTILVATHLLGEWERRVDTCQLLESGRIAGQLPVDSLRAAYGARRGVGGHEGGAA